ncbi:hypothetical protein DA075_10020 [Methylobacterium currus]|uniref:Uncharacterized protein n=1 Tax=Methylobacterium currus TaxID=2051553 RepID=A0A2R4WI51_9HYPH|nr:hypothetical protein [Methylobacterium currus]AWB21208.1 hypothetical protein DA075_10020 [Methylobacterium currus]
MIARDRNVLRVGNLIIRAERWPWQGYGWRSTGGFKAPLNQGGARFGAGWRWKLGICVGSTTVLVELLFGMLVFRWESAADRAAIAARKARIDEILRTRVAE